MISIRALWFLLITSQLTHSILGCDDRLLELEAKSCVCNIQSSSSDPVSQEAIKDHLYFLTDEKNINSKYKERSKFNELCGEIQSQIKNERFIEFLKNCQSVYYDHTSDPEEKYATHILLEAVKNRFNYEQNYFKQLNTSYKRERERQKVVSAFKGMTISDKGNG